MSLLIKALDKAESNKAENDKVESSNSKQKQAEKGQAKDSVKDEIGADLELSLSPTGSALAESSALTPATKNLDAKPVTHTTSNTQSSPQKIQVNDTVSAKSAANVFSAKGVEASNQNTRLALIAGAGLIALLGMGLYYYQFADNTPELVIPPRPLEQVQAQAQAPEALPEQSQNIAMAEPEMPIEPELSAATSVFEPQAMPIKKMVRKPIIAEDEEFVEDLPAENVVQSNETEVSTEASTKANKKRGKAKTLQFGDAIASPSASINVTKTKSEAGVNPILMSAYEAYNAGDDAKAQKLYKQALQHDVRNVDALLGLGAIAARQGRVADANGWYGKVLEVDPRNNIAQAALIENQPQGNETNNESRIKNMLSKNPSDANLHVALGNFYAEQNQWPAAQQAYFDAYSLHASADNAFNLAVSLDQMGKAKLALPYYQRALDLAQTSPNGIDKAALEARIAAIQ
jgi:tetratricopeptide (TPR) repeat protein